MKYSLSFYHKYMFGVYDSTDYEESITDFRDLISTLRDLESKGKVTFDFEQSGDGWVWVHTDDKAIAEEFGFDEDEVDDNFEEGEEE